MIVKIKSEELSDGSFVTNVEIIDEGRVLLSLGAISLQHAIDLVNTLKRNTIDFE